MSATFFTVIFLLITIPGALAQHPCASGSSVTGAIKSVERGTTFRLDADDGRYFPGGIINFPNNFVQNGQMVTVFTGKSNLDRYGRLEGQIFKADKWLQGAMVQNGRAIVYAPGVTLPCLKALRALEQGARQRRLGVWRHHQTVFFAGRIKELSQMKGQFVVVRGKVISVGDRRRQVYLNFGKKWTQDFTVAVLKKGSGAYKGDLKKLLNLANRTVEVRGFLEERQGPLIRLFDEAQIEIVE